MTELDLILEAVHSSVDAAVKKSSKGILFRPATVQSMDPLGVNATVALDGDDTNTPVGVQIVYPTGVIPGDRVLVVFVEPHAAFLIGRRGGDFDSWHFINPSGTSFFDTFNAGWENAAGTNWPNTDDQSFVCYRRHGRLVELRGWASRVSGSSTFMFRIPPDYTPENDLILSGNNGLGGHCPIQVLRNGDVNAPDNSSSVILDGVFYSTNKFGDFPVSV